MSPWGGFFQDLRRESLDLCAVLPGIGGQAGFQAGLFKKLPAVPVPFHSNLGQEESALCSARNQQSVPAHFHLLRSNVHQGRQYGNLDPEGG